MSLRLEDKPHGDSSACRDRGALQVNTCLFLCAGAKWITTSIDTFSGVAQRGAQKVLEDCPDAILVDKSEVILMGKSNQPGCLGDTSNGFQYIHNGFCSLYEGKLAFALWSRELK